MSVNLSVNTNPSAYSLNTPLLKVFNPPIVAKRNPGVHDMAPIGTVWVNTVQQNAYVLAGISSNTADWASMGTQTGSFHSVTVDTGDITVEEGNIDVTAGNISANAGAISGASLATTGDASIGGKISVVGNIVANAGLLVKGDAGAGTSQALTFTNVSDVTQGVGNMAILSANGNSGNNTGFLKIYFGTVTAYIPYFTDIAPSS